MLRYQWTIYISAKMRQQNVIENIENYYQILFVLLSVGPRSGGKINVVLTLLLLTEQKRFEIKKHLHI